ncbi:MAG: hypothetical protein J1G06_09835, partial [Oscillospiraceae bacterium]|nr:hypothetical protein [Oscillospiraceae bacterium]
MKIIDKTKQGIAEGAKSMAGAAAAAMTASVGNTARLVKNTFENTSKSVTAPKITGNAMQGKNSFGTSSKSTAAPKSMNNTASHENPFEKPIKIIGNAMKRADNAVRR